MDLSVVILTRNNKNILDKCITSIYKHTKGVSYEVIVVDNASTDEGPDHIKAKFHDVEIIQNTRNLGFAKANNKGLLAAKGRYCLLLNDDTFVNEDAFSKIVKFMDNDPGIGICGPKLLNIDGSLQHQGSALSKNVWASKAPIAAQMVIGAAMFIRTSIMSDIGMLDENLFFYNEDLDICLRAKKSGYKVIYAPIASVFHYGGLSSKKKRNMAVYVEGIRGGLYFCRKHYNKAVYQLYRAFILAASVLMTAFSAVTYLFDRDRFYAYLSIFNIALKEDLVSKQ
jgi:GT2 family glycosyltransferase